MHVLDETHDPQARSWLESANDGVTPFPLQNLPFAEFRRDQEPLRGGVAIGEQIIDLARLAGSGALDGEAARAAHAASAPSLNGLMALGADAWSALRRALFRALRAGSSLQATLEHC